MEMHAKLKNNELRVFLIHFKAQKEFNYEIFQNLYHDTNEDTVIRMLAHFEENLKVTLDQLKLGLSENAAERIWKAAHKMAGTSELLGFEAYARFSRSLSKTLQATPTVHIYAEEIKAYRENTEKILQQIGIFLPTLRSYL
ncbi:MAG: Hpt domain-containing protein [Pseudobdellovibrio sp.]